MEVLERFENNQRVRVVAHEGNPAFNGREAVVVRLGMRSNFAWVRYLQPLPVSLRVFPADDERCDHGRVYPDECEAL